MTTIRRASSRRGERAWQLRPNARKAVLITHIVAGGSWIGIDVVLVVLVFTARLSADTATVALSYQALGTFLTWPLLVASLVSLISGVALGLGTRYRLFRYWWVAVKLVLNLVLTTLVAFALAPSLAVAADYGRRLAEVAAPPPDVESLIYPAIVSPTALLVAVVLSVAKPWGRTPQRRVRK